MSAPNGSEGVSGRQSRAEGSRGGVRRFLHGLDLFIGVCALMAAGCFALLAGMYLVESTNTECCAAMECPTDMVPRYVDEQCVCVAFLGVE